MASPRLLPQVLLLDLGGVIFDFSLPTRPVTPVPRKIFRKLLETPEWNDYEIGLTSRETCCAMLERAFNLAPTSMVETCVIATESFALVPGVWNADRRWKVEGGARVFVMSYMVRREYEGTALRCLNEEGGEEVFDGVFLSGDFGVRKPERKFYERVLDSIGCKGEEMVFVDDRVENVVAGEGVGMIGVVFDSKRAAEGVARIEMALAGRRETQRYGRTRG